MVRHLIGFTLLYSPGTEGQNKHFRSLLLMPGDVWGTQSGIFLTSGVPLDCSYSPVFLPDPGTEGQNKYTGSVLFIPSDIWVTGNGNLLIFHQWCATLFVLFSLPCLLMVQWTKTNISDVYYLCPVMYNAHRLVTYPFVTSGAPLDCCYSPVFSVYSWPDGLDKYRWLK